MIKFEQTAQLKIDDTHWTVEKIKQLGLARSEENLNYLIVLFQDTSLNVDIRREVVSSIGRQKNDEKIWNFINNQAFNSQNSMELIYQMYRTCLYRGEIAKFKDLGENILGHYDNEMMYKMKEYYYYRQARRIHSPAEKQINAPTLLVGDNNKTLNSIDDGTVQLVFTSPPYYNARIYSDYTSYKSYLSAMYKTLLQCRRVLEDGRFAIINVSPVITKRPGREFESIRYPIHFDFHSILTKAGFYFIDEIVWIKPEYSVPNRVAGYAETRMPLTYKPNCISESLMVYRKNAPFLLDKNIQRYDKNSANAKEKFDTTNCWYISPKHDKKHPAVFPEELCEKVLTYYSFKGDVVLDPFAGSGTFGRVASRMERIPILCEINSEYTNFIKRHDYND